MFDPIIAAQSGGSPLGSLVGLIGYVLTAAAFWQIFTKAGQPGWAGIIPIYNLVVLMRVIGKSGWLAILFFIPLVNVIWIIYTYYELSKSFGHGVGFTIGLVLLSVIFLLILGFGNSQYQGPGGRSSGVAGSYAGA